MDIVRVFDICVTNKISLQQFLLCFFALESKASKFLKYNEVVIKESRLKEAELKDLIARGFLEHTETYMPKDIKPTAKFKEIVFPKSKNPDTWIDDWFDLFPRGVKTGGNKYIRSGKSACNRKLKKFVKDYPEYSVDQIFEATKLYISNCKRNNYLYMQAAPYFIFKDGDSNLESYCSAVSSDNTESFNNTKNTFVDEV